MMNHQRHHRHVRDQHDQYVYACTSVPREAHAAGHKVTTEDIGVVFEAVVLVNRHVPFNQCKHMTLIVI